MVFMPMGFENCWKCEHCGWESEIGFGDCVAPCEVCPKCGGQVSLCRRKASFYRRNPTYYNSRERYPWLDKTDDHPVRQLINIILKKLI